MKRRARGFDWEFVRGELRTALGYDTPTIRAMTLIELYELFSHWKKHPPAHRMMAWEMGIEPELSIEEMIDQGAMGAADFLTHYKVTGGKLPEH